MPLTSDEIAALTSNTTATNNTPQLPTPSLVTNSHPDLPATPPVTTSNSPPDIPPGEPSETHSLSHESSEPLCQANSSSWAARNPTHPIIRPRTPPPRLTDAQKASRKIKRDQKIERMKRLHDAVAGYLDEQKTKIEALSRAHNVTPKQINNIIGSQTHYRTSRKSQLINALVHAKAMEVNVGEYSLAELRDMVANDPQTKSLTKDEKAAHIMALEEYREKKVVSIRANNLAAARDVLVTTERIVKELDDLRIRTGIYATLFVVRGHINDTTQSAMHGTDNSEDFWEDVYEHPMADFLRQYEQWACTQNQSNNNIVCVRCPHLTSSPVSITGKKDIVMNYTNYETAIVEAYGVRLVGWPEGVDFISPSNIGTVGDIRRLRDALKTRMCSWTTLSPAEVKAHTAELDACRSAGEVVRKPRKKRSDAGVARKRKVPPTSNKNNRKSSKRAKEAPARLREAPKSAEFVESSDEEEEEEEEEDE
ncbi:uncharacterized protein F5891DRAFT_965858 [Suillus fuscotomentosus]|uniref:Uncharacterized protein n=1 Tax=Suillus fuscotomentosus TaxID=1912939 RepID=A0AAD4DQ06_9AGAM|nr:uncharacterized protein F5891DRAFT_965858 [Suillus fuscotomentosus]KAG1888969.1 hypothetical protein F5891DRAFT_965858 [Suillus fuscotomentosus]